MNESEIDAWVDEATSVMKNQCDPDLSDLSIRERQAIIARIQQKINELRIFAESGDGLMSKTNDYITTYSREINCLIGLAWRVDPGLVDNLARALASYLRGDELSHD